MNGDDMGLHGRDELLRRELGFWRDESRRLSLLSVGLPEYSAPRRLYESQATYAYNRMRGVRRELEASLRGGDG